ncbi:SRPBCC domain-containing protein [Gordonia sp. HY442]|uniref:SRPBCC family protein n=1 Tax=Gordonia zhenghanii TaxID=2911516 RepID=UPI001F262745|nr:SRPBCC domain-containing protein [Gordonia zhenghanii]MCF8607152.1 SRPBCC domain-containing protein [Gordonia zhenghanii]
MNTDTEKQFTIEYRFNASRRRVWEAWTDPSVAMLWWHPHDVVIKEDSLYIDLREGGSYGYTMVIPDGTEYPTVGAYTKIAEPELLQFTWGADTASATAEAVDEEPPLITVELSERDDGTCDMRFHVQGIADDRGSEHGMYDGWVEAFEELTTAFERVDR